MHSSIIRRPPEIIIQFGKHLSRRFLLSEAFCKSLFASKSAKSRFDKIMVSIKEGLWNPHLDTQEDDYLYHLALGRKTHDLQEMFGDVKFVCVGGTAKRMQDFAYFVKEELGIKLPTGVTLKDLSQDGNRYSMFKIGPVLSVTHGMGSPSLSILLHELLKLVKYAQCKDVVFLRIGTSGGLGIPAGSVVVTSQGVDGLLRPVYELAILGKIVHMPVQFDQDLVKELLEIADKEFKDFKTYSGWTMCAQDFYEGQGRLDGAFCSFSLEEKMSFLRDLKAKGVVNIEMESTTFGSMCLKANIPAAIICVTLVDRLQGDQIIPGLDYGAMQLRPQMLAAAFIKKRLQDYGV